MTFQAKPSYLPTDLKNYEASTWWRSNRDKVFAAIAAVLFVAAQMTPVSEPTPEPLSYEEVEEAAKHYASIIVACANGKVLSIGPKLIYCDSYHMPVMQ